MYIFILLIVIIIYIYIYIYISVPELARHEVGVVVHRAKRVQRCQRPTINDFNDLRSMLSMMDWSTINNWAARTTLHLPFASLKPLFRLPTSASKSQKSDCFSKPQNPPKIAQKAPKTLPQTPPKRLQNDVLCCNPRKSKIMQPSHVFAHFLRSQTLQNRPKIDAKTFAKSALCWIPSWNPQKYDF